MRRRAAPGASESIFSDLKTIAGAFYSNLKKTSLERGKTPKKLNKMHHNCLVEGFKNGDSC